MENIQISVPEYDDCLEIVWENNAKVSVRDDCDSLLIEANREGLIAIARQLLMLAQEEVPEGSHLHLASYNFLEDNSAELTLSKREKF